MDRCRGPTPGQEAPGIAAEFPPVRGTFSVNDGSYRVGARHFHYGEGFDMPVDLSNGKPLAWDSAKLDADTKAMLDNLQPNILQAHVRESMSLLLVHFGDGPDGRRFLRSLVPLMKSARKHLEEVRDFNRTKKSGTPYVGVGISKIGYLKLGHSTTRFTDNAFK